MVWRLVWLAPVHCHIDKDTYSTPFPLNHFLWLSNISILASKSRGWKDSNQKSNNPENAQLTPGHSGSYLNAYICVYLPNGSGRRTNIYISFNANRNQPQKSLVTQLCKTQKSHISPRDKI